MIKTTIMLEDKLYKELVREALEKFGTTKKLSYLINQRLKSSKLIQEGQVKRKRTRVRIGRDLKPGEMEKLIEEGWGDIVRWKM